MASKAVGCWWLPHALHTYPVLRSSTSQTQKEKQVATRPCHVAMAPACSKHSLRAPWCPGGSIALASPTGHLLLAQSKMEMRGAQCEDNASQQGTYTLMRYS